jgi:hypothetical protein
MLEVKKQGMRCGGDEELDAALDHGGSDHHLRRMADGYGFGPALLLRPDHTGFGHVCLSCECICIDGKYCDIFSTQKVVCMKECVLFYVAQRCMT